jgi:serine/threonine protein kinase
MKSINNKKYLNKTYKKSKKRFGGKAVDAGSYGCVFKPAIKCANPPPVSYDSKSISKLMYSEDTEAELIEMAKVKKFIETIPYKEDYFLLSNTYPCKPSQLNEEDLSTFDKKCRLFTKRGITRENVNQNLNQLSLLVMPNGGLNIDKFIQAILELPEKDMYPMFINLNKSLIKLLANGIVKLNEKGFNHYDIKSGNILMGEDGHARLIDWGLAGENDGIHVPETIQDRSIAFNMPFSGIFFNNFVKKWLPVEMNAIKGSNNLKNKTAGQAELLKIVAVNMINESINNTSDGHFNYITENILHDIYKIYAAKNEYNLIDYDMLSTNVMVEYVQAVLLKFVDEDGKFNDARYFYEVFTKNVDIWGFLVAYVPLIEFGTTIFYPELINGICRILLRYCFSTEFATKPIILSELIMELESLNDIVNARTFKPESKKLSHTKQLSQTKKSSQIIKISQTKKQSQNILPIKKPTPAKKPSRSKHSSDISLDYSE